MKDIDRQLQAARQRLLDLTMRNRLLNFRPTKRKTIQVVDEIPREVFDILVLQEKMLTFRAAPLEQQDAADDSATTLSLFTASQDDAQLSDAAETSELWQLLPQDTNIADHHTDRNSGL